MRWRLKLMAVWIGIRSEVLANSCEVSFGHANFEAIILFHLPYILRIYALCAEASPIWVQLRSAIEALDTLGWDDSGSAVQNWLGDVEIV